MRKVQSIIICILFIALSGCATTTGPVIISNYDKPMKREDIAIVMLTQKRSLRILACDGIAVPGTVRYLMLLPGRHELIFSIKGQTIVEVYEMRNKKYFNATEGHTYILKSETGILSIGDKWFPDVVDVTDNPELHVRTLPVVEVNNYDK